MKRKTIVQIGVAALVAMVIPMNAAAILDGERDDDRHPYVVHLVSYETTREGATGAVVGVAKGFCSGFAVSPTLVVTAGHCTEAEQRGDVNGDGFVEHRQIEFVGVFISEDPAAHPLYEETVPVANRLGFDAVGEAIPHPFFVRDFYDHDFPVHLYDVGVVIIRPETPLDLKRYAQLSEVHAAEDLRVPPACASQGQAPCNAPWLLAVGYGNHNETGWPDSDQTQPRHVASVRYEGIEPLFEERYINIRGGIGGHETVAAGSPCFGDSGGPLLLDGTDTVLGVTATGPKPCDYTALGQRIDLPDILDWIQSYT